MNTNYNKGKRAHEDIRDDTGYKLDSPFKCQISYYMQKNDSEDFEKAKHEESPSENIDGI